MKSAHLSDNIYITSRMQSEISCLLNVQIFVLYNHITTTTQWAKSPKKQSEGEGFY